MPATDVSAIAEKLHLVVPAASGVGAEMQRVLDPPNARAYHAAAIQALADTEAKAFSADIRFFYSKISSGPPLTCVATPPPHQKLFKLERVLPRPRRVPVFHRRPRSEGATGGEHLHHRSDHSQQERIVMPKHGNIDENEIKARVDDILRQILEEEDPEELNAYKKLAKRYVPVFRRAYFTAYLLKYADSDKAKARKPGSNGEYTSIFVGVGKNRKVFPKDLIQLFSDVDGVSSDDIGQIKILDNYSFLEITPEKAQPAIDTLNGREFRGRRLTVNFARKKD